MSLSSFHLILGICFILQSSANKIEKNIFRRFKESKTVSSRVIVSFQSTDAVLDDVASQSFSSRGEKITYIKTRLQALQQVSQKDATKILKNYDLNFESFWINNRISIEAPTLEVLLSLAQLPEVTEIRAEKFAKIDSGESIGPPQVLYRSWGIERIQATDARSELGANGFGVTVGIIDTGVAYKHPAIHSNWRQSYGWYDPKKKSKLPSDPVGHGTFVAGLITGWHGLGVATGAKWVACMGCSPNGCDESSLTACGQWMLCPTREDGSKLDCSQAPRIINNSWGSSNGDKTADYYDGVIRAWRKADIIPVFSIGNQGKCKSTGYPGDSSLVIGVGATDKNDDIATFSSRGPVKRGYKPDLSAPGVELISASTNDGYVTGNGTSYAAPLVAGTAALLLSKNAEIGYNKVWFHLLAVSDEPQNNLEACGAIPTSKYPNHVYGYGRLNAYRSVYNMMNS